MAFDLLAIQPHKVSRDLSGYITYIYGAYKTGKTTLACQMETPLLLAFEQGYKAIPGIRPQPVTSWGEMRQIYRELKKLEVRAFYKTVIVDGIDWAADFCKRYICQQNEIEDLGDLGYGKGWTKFKDEFNDIFHGLTQMGYAVVFIGHDKEAKDNNGNVTNIRPQLSNSTREVIGGMADVYAYAKQGNNGGNSILVLRDKTGFIECGCRFKYVPDTIPCNYKEFITAICDAIEKEAAEHNGEFVTDERQVIAEKKTYNYDELMDEFQTIVGKLMEKNPNTNGRKITSIVDKYLGKGKKVSDASIEQVEHIFLIIEEIKDEMADQLV